jgi:Tfp pilus assembly protein PilF
LILNQFGLFLNARGAYAKAEPLCQRALAIREKALGGPEHPEVAQSLENYALLLRNTGIWEMTARASSALWSGTS